MLITRARACAHDHTFRPLKTGRLGQLEKNEGERAKECLSLANDMGPTFIKLGQALSIRTDLIPEAYALELRQLQDAGACAMQTTTHSARRDDRTNCPSRVFLSLVPAFPHAAPPSPFSLSSLSQSPHSATLRPVRSFVVSWVFATCRRSSLLFPRSPLRLPRSAR